MNLLMLELNDLKTICIKDKPTNDIFTRVITHLGFLLVSHLNHIIITDIDTGTF